MAETYIKILNDATDTGIIAAELRDSYVDRVVADECPEGFFPETRGEVPLINEPGFKYGYRYIQHEDHVEKTYHVVPMNYQARRFSKLKLYANLVALGKWTVLEDWMKSQTLPNGINVYTAYVMAQELFEQHQLFGTFLNLAQTVLEMTDQEREDLLNNSLAE